jgi:RNA polymerase sigma factor (sigma-70 family)
MTEHVTRPADERQPNADQRPDLSGPDPAAAFGRLFDEHARSLYRYLARRAGDSIADDLVAETFLVALQSRQAYDPARASARSWLFGIATNLLLRHLRQERRNYRATARAAGASVVPEGHEASVADRVDAGLRARQLAQALIALQPGDRDVLLMISWAEMDSHEVAEALDIPVGTVRSRLHRARRLLRAHAPGAALDGEEI